MRRAAWIAAGIAAIILFVVVGLVLLIQNQRFRQYLIGMAHQKIVDATGVNLRVRDFSVHLAGISPTVDMDDVVVDGAPPYNAQPLLHVDHLSVGVTVVSLLQHNWYLNDITINHPVARVIVDEHGVNNLPQPKNAESSSKTSIFDLGVRHVRVDVGEIYYNDHENDLQADLRNLQFQSGFDPAPKRYFGALKYEDGVLKFGTYRGVVHSLDAEFDAAPEQFRLKNGTLTSGKSKLQISGTVENYSNPKVDANYQAYLDTDELRKIAKNESLPSGIVRLVGTALYRPDANKPAIDAIHLEGNVTSEALLVQTPTLRTQIRNISAEYIIRDGNLDVRNLSAGMLGGTLHASASIHDLNGTADSRLQATVNNIGLRAVQALANPASLQQVAITGAANASIQARWTKTPDNISAAADVNLQGTIAPPHNGNGSIPLSGDIHAQYAASAKQITFSQSVIRMPQTSLTMNGTVSDRSALQVRFVSNDLHEVETAATVFSPAVSQQNLGLTGTASFVGTVKGTTDAPQINGQFAAATLHVKDTDWRSLTANLDLNPSHITVANGDVVPAARGHIGFNVAAALNHWSFDKANPIQVDLSAQQLDLSELKTFAGIQTPITGTLAANVALHGSLENPVGQGTINVTQATISDEAIQSVSANFQGNGDELHANLRVRMPAGTSQSDLTYFPKQERYNASLVANGIRLDQFQTLKVRNMQLEGVLDIQATGSGTINNPAAEVKASIPQLHIQNQTINNLTVQAKMADHTAAVNVDSQAMDTFIRGHGTVTLTGDFNTDATFDTSTIALQPIIATYSPAQAANVSGQTEIHGTVRGPLKDTSRLDAHVTIPTFAINYKNNVQLAAAAPIKLDYNSGILRIERTAIKGTDTDLQMQGSIPLTTNAPASLLLIGTIDLKLAQFLDPDITSSGQIRLNIDSYGQRTNPNVQGQIQLVNANFASADVPVGFENGSGVLNLTTSRLQIERITGNVGGGTLTLTGGVTYRPTLQYNLAISGRGVRFHIPDGVREGIDTDLALTGTKDSGVVQGQIRLSDVSFARDFDFSTVAAMTSGSTPGTPNPLLQNVRLNIGLQSTSDLNLVSSSLSLQGAANLRVQGTAAEPVLLGRVNVTGGDLIFRGAKYEIQPSTIAFVNPYQIEPRVNANVDTTVEQYKVHMQFRGTMDHLRTTYTSDPALPEADVINLLVFGKTSEEQAANPTPGNIAAESAIASAVSSQVTGQIQKVAGISQLSIDPVLKDNQQSPGARISIQQRVTGSVFVTFATDATGTQREVIKLEYQATPRVSVVGVRDQNGGFALDLRIHKTW
jgi:translocation and assembly module TamB